MKKAAADTQLHKKKTQKLMVGIRRLLTLSFLSAVLASNFPEELWAHSGRLNAQGCHGGRRPYHCHRAPGEMTKSSSGGYRLQCSLESRSKDCNGISDSTSVQQYQFKLMRHCNYLPLGFADGSYGPATRHALITFQRAYGLTVNGNYGPETARALDSPISGKCR